MVQNGEGKCKRKTLSGIEVKTIIEDDTTCQKVVSYLLQNFKFSFALTTFLPSSVCQKI